MKRFKRLAALILAVAMCFTLLSSTVTAQGLTEGHIAYNGNGNTGGSAPGNTTFTLQIINWETSYWAQVSGPGSLTKTGYTFSGWNSNAAGTGTSYSVNQWVKCHRSGFGNLVFDDLNLYAQWTLNTYNVTFKTSTGGTINGGTSDVTANNVSHGTNMPTITPTVAANTGYTFSGWSPELPATVTTGGTYTATFTLNKYSVTFKTSAGGTINGGTSDVKVDNVNHGTVMTTITPTVSANSGYHFDGWSPTLPTNVISAGSYTATFALDTFDVTFKTSVGGKINGGTSDVLRSNVTIGTSMNTITPTVTADPGYHFVDWDPTLPDTVTDGGAYTATFAPDTYDVTFKTSAGGKINGGTADVVKNNVTIGTSMNTIKPTVTADTNYHFVDWTPTLPDTVLSGGTYTATFAINTYNVTFKTSTGGKINGGTADVVKNNVTIGTSMNTIKPTVTADTGYHFVEWTPTLPDTVTSTANYTATFALNTYDITFKTSTGGKINGGTSDIAANNVNHGTNMTTITPTVTADTGYHFVTWTPALPTTVTGGGSYTATFALNTYDVTFKTSAGGKINNGTSDVTVNNVNHGTNMSTITPTVTPDTGYHFEKWDPTLPDTVTIGGSYTAKFEINQCTMSFDSNGGSFVDSVTQNYNTQVAKPADPTRAHYTFAGWFDIHNNPISFPYTLTNDINVHAKWTINTYTMMFDSQGGSNVSPLTLNYNSQIAKPADPTRYGFTFSGWYTGINGTGTPITFPYTLTGDIFVYARWSAGSYTMSFNTDGGNSLSSISGNFGEYISNIPAPTKDGFTFNGWFTGPNGTGSPITFPFNITGNVTIYASWIKIATVSAPATSTAASTVSVASSQTQSAASVPQMGAQGLSSTVTIIILSVMVLSGLAIFGIRKFKIKQQ